MNAFRPLVLVVVLICASSAQHLAAQGPGDPVLSPCFIKMKKQNLVRIPAEVAGKLIEMPVEEGSKVKAGQLLARIDDREAKAQLEIAEYALESAEKLAAEDIEIRYAKAAESVARVDWEQDVKANMDQAGAVPDIEIRRKKLDWRRASLQIEKAIKDKGLAGLEAKTKTAERDAAEMALAWRAIYAPFDGEVVETGRHESEWVSPGDLILKLARFDTLYVEGRVQVRYFNRSELQGKEVTVTVTRARGQKIEVTGKVVFVDPKVISDDSFIVRAEIENKREGEGWAIHEGLEAKMKIHMK